MPSRISRRHLLLGTVAAAAGCTEFSDRTPYWATLRRSVAGGGNKAAATAAANRAAELPYASVRVKFAGAPPALFVLEAIAADGTLNWAGRSNQSISTYGPWVTRLIGADIELQGTTFGVDWSPDLRAMLGRTAIRQVRFRADSLVEAELSSRFAIGDDESVDLLAGPRVLRRVDEHVSARGRRRFTNNYWIDPVDGYCWKARQRPIPTLPAFETLIMKRPPP
jgi:hypothetical protein